MKQLSALSARRHAFFRGPRRMRSLGSRLDEPDLLGPGGYGYYGGMREKKPSFFSFFFLPLLCTQPIVLHTQDKSAFFRRHSNPLPQLEITKDSPFPTPAFLHLRRLLISLPPHPPSHHFSLFFPLSPSSLLRMRTTGTVEPAESKSTNIFQAPSLIRFFGTQAQSVL